MATKKFPILYTRTACGAIHSWQITVIDDIIYTLYGLVGGKLQETVGKVATTKNEGRSNATTPEEQALAEAQSLWQNKLDRKYKKTKEEAESEPLLLPMLAKDFATAKKVVYPVLVQPKLDGVRCLAMWEDDKILLLSRAGKPYRLPHLEKYLEGFLPKDTILDGEIYIHGLSCQQITHLVKNVKDKAREKLEYWVYDCPTYKGWSNEAMSTRMNCIKLLEDSRVFDGKNRLPVQFVDTQEAKDVAQVLKLEQDLVAKGFEGAIVRQHAGLYKWGHKSSDLLKVKSFQDKEFKVVDVLEGEGKFTGCAIFVCDQGNGKTFKVSPKVTQEEKKQMYKDRKKYIGQMYTVKFFDYTDDGTPRFPVGKVFRSQEDLPL